MDEDSPTIPEGNEDHVNEPIKVEEPKPDQIRKPTETIGKPKDTPSIFSRKKAKTEEEAGQHSVVDKKSKEFDEELLQQVWKEFGESRINAGDTDKLILNRKITKGNDHKVVIHLASQLEVSFLEKLEVALVQFLRTRLENDHVTIERNVVQEEETKKLYTSKDIFEHMVKENPALKDLKDRLGLDFDY